MKRPAPGEKSAPLRQGRRQKEEGAPAAAETPALVLHRRGPARLRLRGAGNRDAQCSPPGPRAELHGGQLWGG